jgi:hypothetical protein
MRVLKILGGLLIAGAGAGMTALFIWLLYTSPMARLVLVMILLFGLLAAVFFLGAVWNRQATRDGAEIALKAQGYNDAWDARKTAAMATLFREGARIGQRLVGSAQRQDVPLLPLPGQQAQGDNWLPKLTEFGADRNEPDPAIWGDVIEGSDGHD